MADAGSILLGGCCCGVFITLFILLMCSIKGLHVTKFAMKRNSINKRVDLETTYRGGRHVIGFWNDYITFPATLQSLEWLSSAPLDQEHVKDLSPMVMRTSDGLMVQLGITVQYRLVEGNIPDMYMQFKDSYENFFISNIRSGFQNILANHASDDLWVHRHEVAMEFQTECQAICADPAKLRNYIECWGVQLTGANIDDQIESKIIQRQVQVQDQEYYGVKRQAALIRTGTEVMESEYDKNITIARANATGNAFRIQNEAAANAALRFSEAKAQALTLIQSNLSALDHSDIIRYQERVALIEKRHTNMVYGFPEVRIAARGDPRQLSGGDTVAQPSARRLSGAVAEPKPAVSMDTIPEHRFKLSSDVPDPVAAKYRGEL